MSPSARCLVFVFPVLDPALPAARTSAFPSMSRFVRFFHPPPPPSFLPALRFVSLLFLPARSSLCTRTAVLAKEGQQEGIFAEFVGSELVQSWECGDCLIGDIRWGFWLSPSELHAGPCCSSSQNSVPLDAENKGLGGCLR